MAKSGPRPVDLIYRIFTRFQVEGDCWVWQGSKDAHGYGVITVTGAPRSARVKKVHRLAYEFMFGHIPEHLQPDHLCRRKICIYPYHLELVTPQENIKRRSAVITHCPQGHEYNQENTRYYHGHRNCRTCKNERARTKYAEQHS